MEDVVKYQINRNILCIDLKNFYASVECVLRDLDPFKTPLVVADKASVAILLMLLKYTSDHQIKFKYDTKIYFVTYEEVGHGASILDQNISEFVTLDMGCIGLDLAGNEYAVSICAKDSGGPYDYELTTRLIDMARENDLSYTVDIFPFYGSDVGAARRAGVDIKGALIGSGVSASHGMERTHIKGVENTLKLIYTYLIK